MPASRRFLAIIVVILVCTTPLMAQSRNNGRNVPSRRTAPAPTQPPAPTPSTTTDATDEAPQTNAPTAETAPAGRVILPNQGYVPQPDQPTPGTVANAGIPSDPLDRAFWELYDRDRSVTLTGKVTRVEWTQPNTYIYLQANGAVWAVESGFAQFRQASVTPSIRVDEVITVTGYLPKTDQAIELPAKRVPAMSTYLKTNHLVRAGEITTVFGQKLQMGRPPSEREMSDRLKCSPLGC